MDKATELAIRAVVRGLYQGGILEVSHLRSILLSLRRAQDTCSGKSETADDLDELIQGIVTDTGVDE